MTDFESDFDTLFLDGVRIDVSHLPDGVTTGSSENGWLVLNFGLNDSVELLGHPADDPLLA